MFRYLRNWREVWAAYRRSRPLPVLHFRRGFQIHHGSADDPILLLHTVFAASEYRALGASRSKVLLDIGANIGAVTLDRAWRNKGLRIDAYEPGPSTFPTLHRNVLANGLEARVRTFQEAVAGRNGVISLWTGDSSVLTTMVSPSTGGTAVRVPAVSLDCAISRAGASGVAVKIDAEGAEVEILESASTEALAAIDQLVLEYHDSLVPEARARCRAVLVRAGFTCRCTPLDPQQGILVARRRRWRLTSLVPARWARALSADNPT